MNAPENASPNGELIETRLKISLREIGIPPRPTILDAIRQEVAKDNADFHRLVELIRADVALAAGLIKTANAACFGGGRKVTTVHDAIARLGLHHVAQTIAGLSLQKVFAHLPNMERFWDSSFKTAQIAAWLARQIKAVQGATAEDVYTFSLFRDAGIPTLLVPLGDSYRHALQLANNDPLTPFTQLERQVVEVDHAHFGAQLASSWGLPDDIVQAIAAHHEQDELDTAVSHLSQRARQMVALAQLAEYLLQRQTLQAMTREWEKLGAACLLLLGLSPDELPDWLDRSRAALDGE